MSWEVRTMASTTSCFNSTLYRKTMQRFWPLWALYALFWLFLIPFSLLSRYLDNLRWDSAETAARWLAESAYDLPGNLSAGVMVSCVFGVLCAMAAFGYLYSSRSACMMHALPLRREGLFATQYLAGLSFGLLPHLGAALVTLLIEAVLLPGDDLLRVLPSLGLWLLGQSATFLFFFSFAAFCAMFTGHILALPAFYGILNALVIVVYSLLNELMVMFFYGYVYHGLPDPVCWLTPVFQLTRACSWDGETVMLPDGGGAAMGNYHLASPVSLAAYAAAGLVLALLALMVYRYRHVESAGDVVAIALVRPVFKYGVALCAGLCLGTWSAAFFGLLEPLPLSFFVVLWAAAGYFAAEMLLKKSFRVLRAWKGCAATVAVLALVCLGCQLDVFGVVERVPLPGEVASLQVSGSISYPYDSGSLTGLTLTDPEQIGKFTALHRAIVDGREENSYDSPGYRPGDDYISLELRYTLMNGGTLTRQYHSIPIRREDQGREGTVTWLAAQVIADRDIVAGCYDFDYFEQGRLVEISLSGVRQHLTDPDTGETYWETVTKYLDGVAGEDKDALWEAVRADFAEGTIGMRSLFDDQAECYGTEVCFSFALPNRQTDSGGYTTTFAIALAPGARHTLAWLDRWNTLEDIELVGYDGEAIPATESRDPAGEAEPVLP